jgi:hypothetical protein
MDCLDFYCMTAWTTSTPGLQYLQLQYTWSSAAGLPGLLLLGTVHLFLSCSTAWTSTSRYSTPSLQFQDCLDFYFQVQYIWSSAAGLSGPFFYAYYVVHLVSSFRNAWTSASRYSTPGSTLYFQHKTTILTHDVKDALQKIPAYQLRENINGIN